MLVHSKLYVFFITYVYFTVISGTLQDGETMYFLNQDSAFGSAFNVEYG